MTVLFLGLVLLLFSLSRPISVFSAVVDKNSAPHHIASAAATAIITDDNQTADAASSHHFISTLLTVKSEESDGRGLGGIPLVFSHQGNVTITDPPVKINVPSSIHNYTVSSPDSFFRNYANATFLYWKRGDGTNSTERTITISIPNNNIDNNNDGGSVGSGVGSENLTGVYRFYPSNCTGCIWGLPPNTAPPLGIKIVDSEGNVIKGVGVIFSFKNGTVFTSGVSSPKATFFSNLRNATTYVVSLPTTFVSSNNNNAGSISSNSSSIHGGNNNISDRGSSGKVYYRFSHWQGIDGYYHDPNNNRNSTSILLTLDNPNSWGSTMYEIVLTAVYSKESLSSS
jgi:hypothetical protein